jgi:hypothetical protein
VIEAVARVAGVEVREEGDPFVEGLRGLPLAQRRTSRNKAYVLVGADTIFKGPYGPDSLKLLNNLRYPLLIHLVEESLGLPAAARGVYRWKALHRVGSGAGRQYYLAGDSVGAAARMEVEDDSTQVDAAFRVVRRETLLRRVSEVEKRKVGARYQRHPDFDEEVAVAALQHLYLRHLFNVGDSGTHNILVREDRLTAGRPVAGIDFDEHRRPGEGRTLWDCLCKGHQAYLDDVYGPLVGRVVTAEELDPVVRASLDELNALGARWAEGLPAPRREEAVVRVPEVLRRNERVRALLRQPR